MKTILIILSCFILITSCSEDDIPNNKTDENGVIVSMPYIWKRSLHLSTPVSNSGIKVPIYYNNNFVSPITNGGNNRLLAMIDSDNGDILWQWDDRYQPETEYVDISSFYQFNNLLTYHTGGRSYCINLDNGDTHWRIRRNLSSFSQVSGFTNNYFTLRESESMYPDYQERVVYKGNIETGEIEEFIIPDFTLEYIIGTRIGDVTRVIPYLFNGVQHLTMTWQELTDDTLWNFQTYLGLYNYETNEWVYEKMIMNEPNLYGVVLSPPVIYQDKIYANIGHQLVCHNLVTGEQIWSKQFTQDFSFSGFIIEENKIIASNENETLYCLNPDNGSTIWTSEGSGTSSRLSYLNGIVYFSGGGDGKLHAVDISNGKKVWKLNASNIDKSIFASYNPVYVLPAEGNKPARVFAHTLGNVVCFEAYQ